jgi:hypothetical protein
MKRSAGVVVAALTELRVRFVVGILTLVIGVAFFSPAYATAGSDPTAPIVGRLQQSQRGVTDERGHP